jgi:hypothetical protein
MTAKTIVVSEAATISAASRAVDMADLPRMAREEGPLAGSRTSSGGRQAALRPARRSKNSAWLIAAFTASGWNGLVIRKAGSGRSPVRSRSG